MDGKNTAVVAVSGVKNSGKTTLIEKMLPFLTADGRKVAVIKHDGHRFDADSPRTDTGRHFLAGACGTAVFDGEKVKIVRRGQFCAEELIACFPEADLILLEGMKNSPFPKLELVRGGNSQEPVCDPATLLGLVTDLDLRLPDVPIVGLNDAESAAELILKFAEKEL